MQTDFNFFCLIKRTDSNLNALNIICDSIQFVKSKTNQMTREFSQTKLQGEHVTILLINTCIDIFTSLS